MHEIKEKAIGFYNKLPPIGKYLMFSIIVTVIDALISWALSMRLGVALQIANTAGVITGAVLHYIMSSGAVFDTKFGVAGFVVYFSTFVLGLFLANWIITSAFAVAIGYFGKDFAFLVAKGFSIVIPFFALYFLRKFLYSALKKRRK